MCIVAVQMRSVKGCPMSGLGQKQTYAPQQAMSALHRIATKKTDIHKRSCPLCPRKRTCAPHWRMSAKGQKRTWADLFDYFISALLEMQRHGKAERLGGLHVD